MSVRSPVYATVSSQRSPATIVPSETSRRLRGCPSLLVRAEVRPEDGGKAPICFGMVSRKRCAQKKKEKKDGDERMRMDAGMAGATKYLASYSSFSVVFTSRSRLPPRVFFRLSRSVMRLPPRCALCDAFSAPAKELPLRSLFAHLFSITPMSLRIQTGCRKEEEVEIKMYEGASFRKRRQRGRSPGRQTLLPVMLLGGGRSTQNMTGRGGAEAFTNSCQYSRHGSCDSPKTKCVQAL